MGRMGGEKSTKNKLKQRRLVWLNVPQTAPRRIPADSHSKDYLGRSGSLARCCSVHPERQLHLYPLSHVSLNQYEFCIVPAALSIHIYAVLAPVVGNCGSKNIPQAGEGSKQKKKPPG